ncbi:hypothetical protein ACFVS2_11420 [Brevibacillus sp. NPDC058079]|uniref:hypothetical protein n=1 Tax=Brevibacillus sp. NPDC058079 TaxID=3346330 RepID=UPI0036E1A368
MRAIRFRAWDTVQEKMLPVEKIDFRNDVISLDEGDNDLFHYVQIGNVVEVVGNIYEDPIPV